MVKIVVDLFKSIAKFIGLVFMIISVVPWKLGQYLLRIKTSKEKELEQVLMGKTRTSKKQPVKQERKKREKRSNTNKMHTTTVE